MKMVREKYRKAIWKAKRVRKCGIDTVHRANVVREYGREATCMNVDTKRLAGKFGRAKL